MTAAADRHLLFGLLALQNGLIDQGQLMLAFQAWTRDKSKSLADHLEARGDLTGAEAGRARCAGRRSTWKRTVATWRRAWPPSPPTDPPAPAWPSWASPRSRPRSPGSHGTRTATPPRPTMITTPTAPRTLAVGGSTGDGQRFRLLRPHARGGLGEVFVALDCELHREVALKQILEKHADDPVSRQRFVLEAEVTGGLEHPGIVPVYGLGTYGSGRPYYAMRFIKGDSLKEAIEQFHRDDTVPEANRTPAVDPWSSASSSAASSTSATPSITPTPAA